jgi:photosystem II stability/assembly factor-like uncharacterized protein
LFAAVLVVKVLSAPRLCTSSGDIITTMHKLRLPFLIGAIAAFALAATYDAAVFGSLQWRSIGPLRDGRSIACAGSTARPNEYYFGATGGGLWKTTDGGLTWRPVTDGHLHSSSVGAIAVAASNPDIIYLGMGETELRGNIMQGDGVYKSTDAGRTWKNVGLADTQAISRIRVHPTDPNIVYVSALGHPYGRNRERGVFRSRDGGATWQSVLFRDDHSGAVDLVMDPRNPDVLFAAIWDANRTPWGLTSGGPSSGLYKTTDGGDHWTDITRNPGMPAGVIGKIGVAISGADSARIYAMVENEDGGLFVSDDAGATWKKINEDRNLRQRAFYYTRIYADPKAKDTVYVLNTSFYRSTDGGKTFRGVQTPHGDNHDLWIDPANPLRMIESNDGGGNVSINGGQTWTGQQYATAQLYHVAVTTDIPYHVCGAQQDSSTTALPVPPEAVAGAAPPTRMASEAVRAAISLPTRAIPISFSPDPRARCSRATIAAPITPATFRSTRSSSPGKAPALCRSAGSGRTRLSFRPSIRTSYIRPRSTSGRPPTTATVGPASPAILPAPIRRLSAIPAAPSLTIRTVPKSTAPSSPSRRPARM